MHLWLAIICHNIIYINLENKTLVLVHDHSRNLVLVHDCSSVRNIYCTLLWSKITILDMDFYGWIFCWNLEFLSNSSHSFQGFYISFRKRSGLYEKLLTSTRRSPASVPFCSFSKRKWWITAGHILSIDLSIYIIRQWAVQEDNGDAIFVSV